MDASSVRLVGGRGSVAEVKPGITPTTVSDAEVERAITYMGNHSGGKWVEPVAATASPRSGEQVVKAQCVKCHGTGGRRRAEDRRLRGMDAAHQTRTRCGGAFGDSRARRHACARRHGRCDRCRDPRSGALHVQCGQQARQLTIARAQRWHVAAAGAVYGRCADWRHANPCPGTPWSLPGAKSRPGHSREADRRALIVN